MPASDYVVLLDSNRDLDEGTVADFTARIPPLSEFDRTASPILWFNVQPLTSQRLKFNVFLNDATGGSDETKIVLTYDSPDDIRLLRSIHEVLAVKLFIPGDDNIFLFKVVAHCAVLSRARILKRAEHLLSARSGTGHI